MNRFLGCLETLELPQVWGMMQEEFEERTDPMAMVFPKVVIILIMMADDDISLQTRRWQSARSTSTVQQGQSNDTTDSVFFRSAPINHTFSSKCLEEFDAFYVNMMPR